jgi:GntR family transcriptional regulator/MocR family aminotransferase
LVWYNQANFGNWTKELGDKMPIQLSRQTDQPLYLQVAEQLRQQIESGELAPFTRLPASRILAKKLGVNRITIVNAYAELEAEGLVTSRVGSGTFVAADHNSVLSQPSSLWRGPSVSRQPWNANQMVAEMMRLARQPGVISFAGGAPTGEFVPVNQIRRALNEVLRRDGVAALQYDEAAGYEKQFLIYMVKMKKEKISSLYFKSQNRIC